MLTLDASDDDGKRSSGITVNDAPAAPLTPEILTAYNRIYSMPKGLERDGAMAEFMKTYPKLSQRAYLGRDQDDSVGLKLRDVHGKVRAALRVKADGTPILEFLDESGKVMQKMTADGR
ncbi:hypothetical protein [Granulicella sibirica]|uniref:Uncharacterized protein n=1 Tax=Granulicella sibirica TaxID=2479048 RepID=A0A4Q0T6H3_9BACT|nr:hypothetical protein [Granulicella sibirica]RXH58592.1 hypothetical protein GRAN_1902 [Granulicella sibirica]